MSAEIAIVAIVVASFALVSGRVAPTPISGPMVFVAVGLVTGPEILDVVDLGLEIDTVDLLGEATLSGKGEMSSLFLIILARDMVAGVSASENCCVA